MEREGRPELDFEAVVIELTRTLHAREADDLLRRLEAGRGRFQDCNPVVIRPGRELENRAWPG